MLVPMIMLSGCMTHAVTLGMLPCWRYTRNGGMRFLRVGKLQLSWCICKRGL